MSDEAAGRCDGQRDALHPPTVDYALVVNEASMVEGTATETGRGSAG